MTRLEISWLESPWQKVMMLAVGFVLALGLGMCCCVMQAPAAEGKADVSTSSLNESDDFLKAITYGLAVSLTGSNDQTHPARSASHPSLKRESMGASDLTEIDMPTAVGNLTFNGVEQTGVAAGAGYTVTGGSATNAGDYTAWVTPSTGYAWTGGSTSVASIPWSIAKADPTLSFNTAPLNLTIGAGTGSVAVTYVGDGAVSAASSDESKVTASYSEGYVIVTPVAATLSPITITVSASEGTNYNAASGTFTVTVSKQSVARPTASTTSFTYDGTEKTCLADAAGYTVQGGSATNAGSYTAIATLQDGYEWATEVDGSKSAPVSIPWTIDKKAATITLDPSSLSMNAIVDASAGKNVAVTYDGDGQLNAYAQSGVDIVDVSLSGTTVNVKPLAPGSATVVVSADPGANYAGASVTFAVTVAAEQVAKPNPTVTSFTYDGNEKVCIADATGYTVANGSATNAGNYTATATLQSGYAWADDTTDPVSIGWSIAAIDPTLTVDPGTLSLNAFDDKTAGKDVTVAYNGDGTVSAAVTAGSDVIDVSYANGKVNVKPKKAGPATIKVSATAGTNFNAATDQTIEVTVANKKVTKPTAAMGLVYDVGEQIGVAEADGFTVTDGKKTNAGSYTAVAKLAANCEWADDHSTDDLNVQWSIAAANFATVDITGVADSYEVTGAAIEPVPRVTLGNAILPDADYQISYGENTAIGNGSVTVSPASTNFTGDPRVFNFAITTVAERDNVTSSGGVTASGGILNAKPADTAWLELAAYDVTSSEKASIAQSYSALIGEYEVTGVFNVDMVKHLTAGGTENVNVGVGALALTFPVNVPNGTKASIIQLHNNGTATPTVIEHKGLTVQNNKLEITLDNRLSTFVITTEAAPDIYQVTFDSKGGSAVAAAKVESGKTVAKPADPTRSGYTFKEWQLDGKAYDFSKPVTSNLTLEAVWTEAKGDEPGKATMFRLYNPNSGEHFYTAVAAERDDIVNAGWNYEGEGWTAPETSDAPVYRLYSGTDHHYTTNVEEKDWLVGVGWSYEGVGWYSAGENGVPLYRQFNPNVDPAAPFNNSGSHNYTTSLEENDFLVSVGWQAEGIGWYGLAG